MHPRRACHRTKVSLLVLTGMLLVVTVLISLSMAVRPVQAASSHTDVMTLNGGITSASLLDPNMIFLLFVVAMIGIYLEISHPGTIVPGVAGVIALLLFLFTVGFLSPNWAGLALMVLAFVLLILDVQLPTHGVLTIGAVISLIVGALLFFNSGSSSSEPQISPLLVYTMGGIVGLIGLTLVTFIVQSQRLRVTTGVEGMIGARAVALTPLLPEGRVSYCGEDWAAILDVPTTSLDVGSEVQIVDVEGLWLRVRPVYAPNVFNSFEASHLG